MIVVAVIILAGFLFFTGDDEPSPEANTVGSTSEFLVREDSARLSDGTEAVFVEFLDFECEACLAVFPVIEKLRERYGEQVSFVVRHMPLHSNSVDAALAAEAAAEQGEFEAMYQRLFETVEGTWGHKEVSQREEFFRLAESLGLDMERFKATYDDPKTLQRIQQSKRDGETLGVPGTPTFFLDGERLDPRSTADLENAFEAALG